MISLESEERVSIEQHAYALMKGVHEPDDAQEMLSHLIERQLDFIRVQRLSQHVRFGISDKNASRKMKELEAGKASIEQLVTEAKQKGKLLWVESNININLL